MKKILLLFFTIVFLNMIQAIQRFGNVLRNPNAFQVARIGMQSSMRPANKSMATEVGGIKTIAVEAGRGATRPLVAQPVSWIQKFRTALESPANYVRSIFERRTQKAMAAAQEKEGRFFEEQKDLLYNAPKAGYEQAKLDLSDRNIANLRRATENYLGSLGTLESYIKSWRGISESLSQRPFLSAEDRLRGKAYYHLTEDFTQKLAQEKVRLEGELLDLKRRESDSDFIEAYQKTLSDIQRFESILPAFDEKLLTQGSPYGYLSLENARNERKRDLDSMSKLVTGLHKRSLDSERDYYDSTSKGRAKAWNEKIKDILEKYKQEESRL